MNAFRSRRDTAAMAYDILPPEAIGSARGSRATPKSEVEDAQFVTVRDEVKTSRPTTFENDNRRRQARPKMTAVSAQPASFIPRVVERIEGLLARMSADFFSALVAFVFLLVFGLAGGFALVTGTDGEPARAAGLDITHVTLTPQDAGGLRVLVINGIVENRAGTTLVVPPIRAEVLIDGRAVASTLIAPPATHVMSEHSHGFTARIPHPGGKNPQLRLSFADEGATAS